MALLALQIGLPLLAEESADKTASLRKATAQHRQGLVLLSNLASAKAEQAFREAYQLRRELLGPFHSNTVSSLYCLAKACTEDRHDGKEAVGLVRELQSALTNAYPGQVVSELIESYDLLNAAYLWLEDKPQADSASAIAAQLRKQHPNARDVVSEDEYSPLGDSTQSKKLQAQASRMAKQQSAENLAAFTNAEFFKALSDLSQTVKSRNTNTAERMKPIDAQRTFLRQFQNDHPEAARMLGGMGFSANPWRLDPEKWFAVEWRKWKALFETGAALEVALLVKDEWGPFEMVPVEMEQRPEWMARLVIQLKGLLLESEARLQASLRTATNTELHELGVKFLDAQKHVWELQARKTDLKDAELATAFGQASQLRQQFRRQWISQLGGIRTNFPAVEDVSGNIPPGFALVEFLSYGRDMGDTNRIEPSYGAVVIVEKKSPSWVYLGPGDPIRQQVRRYQELMRWKPRAGENNNSGPPDQMVSAALESLYSSIWRPLEGALQGATNVIISPDGDLHLVSFGTLMKNNRFLAQDHSLRYVQSGRNLLATRVEQNGNQCEIWADPTFNDPPAKLAPAASFIRLVSDAMGAAESQSRSFFQGVFKPIPCTADEAIALQKVAADKGLEVHLHRGAEASKSELLELKRPLVLHLATHGFFLTSTNGTRTLGSMPSGRKPLGQALMHGGGIALAGANRVFDVAKPGEARLFGAEGLVFAADLATLDLQNTWLATLSACDSGIGTVVDGEGGLALHTALTQAGVQNVLFTLWPVDDKYAVNFMRDFYMAALSSRNAPRALANLQRRELVGSPGSKSLLERVRLAGPFLMTTTGNLSARPRSLR